MMTYSTVTVPTSLKRYLTLAAAANSYVPRSDKTAIKKRNGRLRSPLMRAVTFMHLDAQGRTTYSSSTSCARAALQLPLPLHPQSCQDKPNSNHALSQARRWVDPCRSAGQHQPRIHSRLSVRPGVRSVAHSTATTGLV